LFLDVVDDWINTTYSNNLSTNFTISTWIKPASNIATNGRFTILSTYSPGWIVDLPDDSGVEGYRFYDGSGVYKYNAPGSSIPLIWAHIVFTRNSSNKLTLYIDGVQKQVWDFTATIAASNNSIVMGKRTDGYYFNGTMDEVMIFNRSLNASEVRGIYEMGRDPGEFTDSSLVSWWGFNDKTANDTRGRNNGTLTGGAFIEHQNNSLMGCWHLDNSYNDSSGLGFYMTKSGHTNLNNIGVFNHSVSFDGIDDYAENTSFSWSVGGAVTVVFWNKVNTAQVQSSSAFGVNVSDDPNRFQAHVPWIDNVLYWDYGSTSANGRISINYLDYLNKWTHVALVSKGNNSNFKAIYLDGQLANSSSVSDGPDTPLAGITIGRAVVGASTFYHNGSIDEFMIFNRSLSAAEIAELYARGRAKWEYTESQSLKALDSYDNRSSNLFYVSSSTTTNILPSYMLYADNYSFYSPLINTVMNATLNVASFNVTICNATLGCIFIRNNSGSNVAVFDKSGNLDVRGSLSMGSAGTPDGSDFVIKNSAGTVVAWIDGNTGNLRIAGGLMSDLGYSCTAPSNSFIVKDNSGNCVSYIDSSGNVWLKGLFNEYSQI
jgi:hypothetical protein